jgi:hypothetical protein
MGLKAVRGNGEDQTVDMSGNYTRVLSLAGGCYLMSVESTARFLGRYLARRNTLQKPLYQVFVAVDRTGE